jgi:hypothetical protein
MSYAICFNDDFMMESQYRSLRKNSVQVFAVTAT